MSPRVAAWLLAPALLFIGLFFVAPVAALLSGAFRVDGSVGLAHFAAFFDEPLHRDVTWRTLRIAGLLADGGQLAHQARKKGVRQHR